MTSSRTLIDSRHNRVFRRLTLFTVITIYLLIVAGGVVRSTGAGMGCPDWPKCFGSWIPPTEVSQLPLNYKEIYGAKLKGEVEFNVVKTWIEYVNRLLGAFTGVLIFATLLLAIPYIRTEQSGLFYASLVAFVLVGFQGWLGSKVVSTELHPVMVTLHMLVAILIVFILLFVLARVYAPILIPESMQQAVRLQSLLGIAIALSLVQIIMGTQVREAMDVVIADLGYAARTQWISQLGASFYIHRTFSLLVLIINGLIFKWARQYVASTSVFYSLAGLNLLLIGLSILTGIIMAYWAVPAIAQPLHLTLAILLIGGQFVMWLIAREYTHRERQNLHINSIGEIQRTNS
jgi:heme a synthase